MLQADIAQLRAVVRANVRPERRGDSRVLAVTAQPAWTGPELIEAGGTQARVVGCRSPLAVRAALLDQDRRTAQNGGGDELLVILTDCPEAELGLDVRARLLKGQVVALDPYSSLRALFQATVLDPQLVAERWLVDDLIALAPSDGWPSDHQSTSGVLDIDLAWRTWHRARLNLDCPPAGIAEVLELARRPEVTGALAELPPDQRERVVAYWTGGNTASPIPVMVDLLASGDPLVMGLVAEVLWAPTDDTDMAARQTVAQARLEGVLGRDRLDERMAAGWAEAVADALVDDAGAAAVHDAAEQVLVDAGSTDLAVLSDQLPLGFEQRLAGLGRALLATDVTAAENALADVEAHVYGSRRGNRVRMAEAAVRLLRRRVAAPSGSRPAAASFSAAVADYVADGAWVDAACRLLSEGDHVPDLAAAYQVLVDAAAAERTTGSRRFAALLAEWSAAEPLTDPRFVPVEDLLERVVGPIAAAAPVLLVVCDGMGLAVSYGLVDDLWRQGWGPASPADQDGWPVGVAALPTVTDVSRASLLCGRRIVGHQAEETGGFTTHPALRAASTPIAPPILKHKAQLVAPNGVALPDDLRRQVADPGQRIVGVVVNSVDDHLARGDQVRVGWDLLALRPLSWLLDAAAEAGRIVVLSADHGHVLHGPASVSRPHSGGGERWRTLPPPPADDEVEVAGPRVLRGDGRVVLPADERVRYGGFKHGYHGGATPEEVLVPVEVLARTLPDGWAHRPVSVPTWWRKPTASVTPMSPSAAPELSASLPDRSASPATLFDEPATASAPSISTASAGGSWVDALLAAPGFETHRRRSRLPRPISDDRLRSYLDAVVANGYSIPLAALASRTGEPPDALRLAMSLVQRLLNVDGSAVLVVQGDTVVLNRELAEGQFEIQAGTA